MVRGEDDPLVDEQRPVDGDGSKGAGANALAAAHAARLVDLGDPSRQIHRQRGGRAAHHALLTTRTAVAQHLDVRVRPLRRGGDAVFGDGHGFPSYGAACMATYRTLASRPKAAASPTALKRAKSGRVAIAVSSRPEMRQLVHIAANVPMAMTTTWMATMPDPVAMLVW